MNQEQVLELVKEHFGEGCHRICKERKKQIDKYGFTAEHHNNHPEWYEINQLQQAAHGLLAPELYEQAEVYDQLPEGWDQEWWNDMCNRPQEERLVISAALCAAEIDRMTF